jgi:dipeptidase D
MITIGHGLAACMLLAAACGGRAGARSPLCDHRCVVDTFKQLAPIYRASGEEGRIRETLMRLAAEANGSRWRSAPERLQILGPDGVGNFLIRVPATGRLAAAQLPPVALQAHLDMVLAARDVPAGGDLKAFFRANPIRLEEKDGQLRSVGGTTSIGADNTVGCALMLRYALDPTLEHPPLELVFTVQEEVGLKGAQGYDTAALPLRAPVMISLDGFHSDRLMYGSQGSARRIVRGALATGSSRPGKLVQVAVTGLLGGHSGADIHKQRLNAAVALAAIARTLLADASLAIVRAVAGEVAGLNKIPTDLQLTLSAPARLDVAALRARAGAAVRRLVESHPGEAANPDVEVAVTEEPAPEGPVTVLTAPAARRLIDTVLAAAPMSGVVSQAPDYPNGVNTSANLGLLEVRADPAVRAGQLTALGFMARSFSREELEQLTARFVRHLQTAFSDPESVAVDQVSGYQPWRTDPASWLVRLALDLEIDGRRPFRGSGVQTIGVEPSYFSVKYPDLQIVGMGATISEAHTVHEAVSIQSILDIGAALDAFLLRLAAAAPFRTSSPRS